MSTKSNHTRKSPKKPQNPLWTVSGANWKWKRRESEQSNSMELATQALEEIWKGNGEDTTPSGAKVTIKSGETPKIGVIMKIEHSKMRAADKLYVYSGLVLANAGFHDAAADMDKLAKQVE